MSRLLVGHPGPIPAPPIAGVTCEEVPSELCHAAHAEAVANGLFLDSASLVVHAVVRPTTVRAGAADCAPLVDISFRLSEQGRPLVVTVGRSPIPGRPIVCTY
jgi:hypothetical protein